MAVITAMQNACTRIRPRRFLNNYLSRMFEQKEERKKKKRTKKRKKRNRNERRKRQIASRSIARIDKLVNTSKCLLRITASPNTFLLRFCNKSLPILFIVGDQRTDNCNRFHEARWTPAIANIGIFTRANENIYVLVNASFDNRLSIEEWKSIFFHSIPFTGFRVARTQCATIHRWKSQDTMETLY